MENNSEINISSLDGITEICLGSHDEWDFCRRFVYSGILGDSVVGCALASVNNRGELELAANFGQIDFSMMGSSIWDESLAARAIRGRSPEFTSGGLEYASESFLVAIPLSYSNAPIGAVLVHSKDDLSRHRDSTLPVVSKLVGFVMQHGFKNAVASTSKLRMTASPDALSNRQIRILELMAEKLINADIAKALMVSESTVRQESVRIYRALGVADRSSAVTKAIEYGFLKGVSTSSASA